MRFSKRLSILEVAAKSDIARPKIVLIQGVKAGDDGELVTSEPTSGFIFGVPGIALRQDQETVEAFEARLEVLAEKVASEWRMKSDQTKGQ